MKRMVNLSKHRFISILTALVTGASAVTILSFAPTTTLVADANAVYNDFEQSYGGWYNNTDNVVLTTENSIGYKNSKGMRVTNRYSSADGVASSKGLYLTGGIEYDYNIMVYSENKEKFTVTLMYTDEKTEKKTTVELISENVKAKTWTNLSADFKAPKGTYEYLLTITTDSANDFIFDEVKITAKSKKNIAYAANENEKGLKDAYASYFRVGNTLNNETVKNSSLMGMFLKEYNSVTCGNQMKPDYLMVHSESKNDNVAISLKSCAAIMDFCVQNNLGMRGHTLVWHSQTPSWFFKKDFKNDGAWVDKNTMDKRLENYIKNVFSTIEKQYPTLDLYAYDVCNECIANSEELFKNNNGIREPGDHKVKSGTSAWVQIYKDNSYVEKAFTFARKYAPEGCELYYNDYNEYWDGKRDRIYELCKPLYEKGVLDGIGMQSHISANATGFGGTDSYIKAMKKFLSIGCDVQITELDVSLEKGKYTLQNQADKYKAVFKAAMDWNESPQSKGHITAVCMWGLYDTLSWIGAENKPLLYDDNIKPKLAHETLMKLVPQSEWGEGLKPPADIEPDSKGWYFNSVFEESTDGWNARGGANILQSGRKAYEGEESLLVENRTSSWHGATYTLDSRAFKAGKSYSFSVNVTYLEGDDTDKFYLKLEYTNGDGDTKYSTIAEAMATKGQWIQLANTDYMLPNDAINMKIYVETAKSTNNFYIDDATGATAGTVINGAVHVEAYTLGDIDNNGRIDILDMIFAKKGLIEGFSETREKNSADINKNGKYDVSDVILLQKFLLGITKDFS